MRARLMLAAFAASCGIAAIVCGIGYLHSITSHVVVSCEIGNASVENVRWVEDDGERYLARSLLPGERAYTSLGPSSSPRRGHLTFDLVLDGGRVVLHTRNAVTIEPGDTQTLRLVPETAVDHALLN